MAYGIKYRFRTWSVHGVLYTVNLLKNGWSGSVTERPLGGSPVIRMQENGQFRATSCNLKLECQTDGEFAELYTSDPNEFQVQVFRGGSLSGGGVQIWGGFVATEIYAEPDIAPPYDVDITATDGLGLLKEYDFEGGGSKSVRAHLQALLKKTGLDLVLNTASAVREYQGTAIEFMDDELINLDFLIGENCYDVLGKLLDTFNATITQAQGSWLIIRETDANVTSGGNLAVIRSTRTASQDSTATTMALGATVGKMGVADMWPVGFLTRRVVPAKREVTIQAPWHSKSGAPSVSDNGWTAGTNCTFNTNRYTLGSNRSEGRMTAYLQGANFKYGLRVVVKASRVPDWDASGRPGQSVPCWVAVKASWVSTTQSATYYWHGDDEIWDTSSPSTAPHVGVEKTNEANDVSYCEAVEIKMPAVDDPGAGFLSIAVEGLAVDVYDVSVEYILGKGYQDTIIIDNGARGKGDTVEILGGRRTSANNVALEFLYGVFYGGPSTGVPTFCDWVNSNKDWMTLTALSYAKSIAGRRIETTGTIDMPSGMTYAPLLIYHHAVWSLMNQYDWNLKEEEIRFTARTLPTVTLDVESENITSLGD